MPTSALIERLVSQFGASWVDDSTVDAWAGQGGRRVLLFAGDPVQFPEGLDVAVVLARASAQRGAALCHRGGAA